MLRNRVRRTHAFVLRAESQSTVVWPGSYIEVEVPIAERHEVNNLESSVVVQELELAIHLAL